MLKASVLYYGLCAEEIRSLAYEYANQLGLNVPNTWSEKRQARSDWLRLFMKRHPNLSLQTPKKTSLSRANSFNKHNVQTFFKNYSLVLKRHGFTPENIWNVDDTVCTTVQNSRKIIAATGVKQAGAMVSAERGQLVTLCCAISASGNTIPPMFVFSRVHYKDHFIKGAPTGIIGLDYSNG